MHLPDKMSTLIVYSCVVVLTIIESLISFLHKKINTIVLVTQRKKTADAKINVPNKFNELNF